MNHIVGRHPGALWYKCDFQCHTPRDPDWRGVASLPGGTPEFEAARSAWADTFVAACVDRGLQLVAVTDHHDTTIFSYVKGASALITSQLVVLPGVEITCDDDAQCLAIFDPKSDDIVIEKLFGKLSNVLRAPENDAKSTRVTHAGLNVIDLFEAFQSDVHLREHCLLIPHFSDGSAHKHLNVARHHPRFAELDCYGVYVEKPFHELEDATVRKAHGLEPNWGTRRRAILTTGDNRSEDWGRLGTNDCWIKLGEPTIEGIRQALLADEARIMHTPPDEPSERIAELRALSALTGPTPLCITFNPGFNAFIGGRGSGKSSILQYLRFGLGRAESDLPAFEVVSTGMREAELVRDTLQGGYVEIVLEREGVNETWRRDLSNKEVIKVTDAVGRTTSLTLDAAHRRFRARAFHQKGLSTTMVDRNVAADQITGIAAAEELERRREIDQAISNAQRDVNTALQQIAAHWQRQLERRQANERVSDLRTRIAALAQRLSQEGVSAEHMSTIEEHPRYPRAKTYFGEVRRQVQLQKERFEELARSTMLIQLANYPGIESFDEVSEIHRGVTELRDNIVSNLRETYRLVAAFETNLSAADARFRVRAEAFESRYSTALTAQTAHKALIEDNTRLTKQLEEAEAVEARAAASAVATQNAVTSLSEAQEELAALIEGRQTILAEAAARVASRSSGMLKARMKRDPQPTEYVSALCTILEGSKVHEAEAKCSKWVKDILEADRDGAWQVICTSILEAYSAKIMAGSPPEPGADLSAKIRKLFFGDQLTEHQTRRVYNNLNDATVGAVLSATPKDFIVLTYVDEVGRSIDFQKASPGQQASALLELLLQQSAGTLIIDQPEDDLDNRVVMKIVQLIRTSKSRRQLIFATHNPNIVVNGDADKVITLKSGDPTASPLAPQAAVTLEQDGAIETVQVREAITRIMEGGREAFDLRSRKYRFDVR